MNINITDPNGIELKTAGKACEEDIIVKPVLQSKTATSNGLITADEGYAGLSEVIVNIAPSGTKKITSNGDHDVAAYETADVNVPPPDGYVKPAGIKTVTANGTYDVAEYQIVKTEVPADDAAIDMSDATATANDIVKGYTAYTNTGQITGTIIEYVNGTSGTDKIYVASSYKFVNTCAVISTNYGVFAVPLNELSEGETLYRYVASGEYFQITCTGLKNSSGKIVVLSISIDSNKYTIKSWGLNYTK